MPAIVLATQNAKWIHASFGLRSLRANLGELREQSAILEFEIGQRPNDVAEAILAAQPKIVGLGVYVWNAGPALQLARILKAVRPELRLVVGGPEVSHETERQAIAAVGHDHPKAWTSSTAIRLTRAVGPPDRREDVQGRQRSAAAAVPAWRPRSDPLARGEPGRV